MGIGTPSGTWNWSPPLAEYILESLERINVFGPAIEERHVIGLRRSMNFILSDWSNRGINLWTVDQIDFGLVPGQATYQLPANTIDLLDTYLRTYGTGSPIAIGQALTPAHDARGNPMLQATGEPVLVGPSSGTFSIVAGSQVVTMYFPNHNLSLGSAMIPETPLMIGATSLPVAPIVVTNVIDQNNVQFLLPSASIETRNGIGGTPLFVTKSGSPTVTVVLPGHGLSVGATFPVQIPTAVGGLVLSGNYTVQSLPNPAYSFTISASVAASSSANAFEASGQINLTIPGNTSSTFDLILTPISRNDYAALPLKMQPGRPTSFWFDRVNPPTVTVWPVPPVGSQYGFNAFRTRRIQDASPSMGETLDAPSRFYNAFVASLTASAAEKWKPEVFKDKLLIAEAMWDRAQASDREKVATSYIPNFSGF